MNIEFPYLIGIALIKEESGIRAMPLGGKSLQKAIKPSEDPGDKGHSIALELFLRVLQRSDKSFIKRSAEEKSFLLIQMSMEIMQKKLPIIKAEWINSGDTKRLLNNLDEFCEGVWKIDFAKHSGVYYEYISLGINK